MLRRSTCRLLYVLNRGRRSVCRSGGSRSVGVLLGCSITVTRDNRFQLVFKVLLLMLQARVDGIEIAASSDWRDGLMSNTLAVSIKM